jgi:hypothetical protein
MTHADIFFTVASKIRPVMGDFLIQIQQALIGQPVDAGCGHPFCRGIDIYQGIFVPMDILKLFGKLDPDPDYDYKKGRTTRSNEMSQECTRSFPYARRLI